MLLLFDPLVRLLSRRALGADRFATLAAILGVALGTATVDVVLILDVNTVAAEAGSWSTDPRVAATPDTIAVRGISQGELTASENTKTATHEDYEVMRSAVRLASLAAFLVGALVVFFTFGVVAERRRRELGLLRALGALPRQAAAILVRESVVVGLAGAALGVVASVPMAWLAAAYGMSTTGRSRLVAGHLLWPWRWMALVAIVGAATALLGVARPAWDVFRLDVARARGARAEADLGAPASRTRGATLVALPFGVLVYALLRPFFRQALPSLTFFVLEAILVCAAFLATMLLAPMVVRVLGGAVLRVLPTGRFAERLLVERRVRLRGDELSWSVSGVMVVFALLLALHTATTALRDELAWWANEALHDELFVLSEGSGGQADLAFRTLPPGEVAARVGGRTPWPNAVVATDHEGLAAVADAAGRADLAAIARHLAPGKIVLSRMMARRHHVREGDRVELSGRAGARLFEVVGVTDGLGFLPASMAYRNAKTYGVVDAADADLLAPYAERVGSSAIVAHADHEAVQRWRRSLDHLAVRNLRFVEASAYARYREQQSSDDFVVFDMILALTTGLAALGIANQLVLAVRGRRRELALYRALGMTRGGVRRLVVLEGAFVGILGGAMATALGVPLGFAAVGALRAVSAFEVAYVLPVRYVVFTMAGAVVVSLLASLYPASMAARVDAAAFARDE